MDVLHARFFFKAKKRQKGATLLSQQKKAWSHTNNGNSTPTRSGVEINSPGSLRTCCLENLSESPLQKKNQSPPEVMSTKILPPEKKRKVQFLPNILTCQTNCLENLSNSLFSTKVKNQSSDYLPQKKRAFITSHGVHRVYTSWLTASCTLKLVTRPAYLIPIRGTFGSRRKRAADSKLREPSTLTTRADLQTFTTFANSFGELKHVEDSCSGIVVAVACLAAAPDTTHLHQDHRTKEGHSETCLWFSRSPAEGESAMEHPLTRKNTHQ